MVNESSILRPCFDILYRFHFYVGVEKPKHTCISNYTPPAYAHLILYQSDWIPAHERAGSREGGCVDTLVLGVSVDASEMTYVASVHTDHVSRVHVTKQ